MIDHIGVADVGRSAAFYDDALGALGLRRVTQMPEGEGTDGIGYGVDYSVFWIDRLHPIPSSNTPLLLQEREQRLTRSLRAGGTDNGTPGLRRPRYYAAFVLDPDGNNIEAVYRGD